MVPNGWSEVKLGEVIKHQKGFAFKSASYKEHGIRIVRISDTTRNSIHDKSPVYLDSDEAKTLSNFELKSEDIILTTVGSRPHLLESMVGKAVKVPVKDNGSLLNQNLVKISPTDKLITNNYLFSMLTKSKFIYFISTLVRGNANQVSITLAELFTYTFLLPTYEEQEKIANIVETWNKAITVTERLIDNSKQQKKSLMQQLLTGKKRLFDDSGKPFEGKWEVNSLEELTTKISDGIHSTPKYADVSQVRFVNGNNLKNGKIVFQESTKYVDEENAKKHRRDLSNRTILMSINGTIGNLATYNSENIVLGKSSCYMNIKQGIDLRFIFFKLASSTIQSYFISELTGSTIKNLSLKTIKTTKFKLPSYEEQQKIAAVLTNADKEIELLEQQLADLKQEKKALMQQLLTGKRRVKIN